MNLKNRVDNMDRLLREAFNSVKDEMNNHLDSINENTNEILENNNYLYELDQKINKLNDRIDEILLLIGQRQEGEQPIKNNYNLTFREQETFMAIYTMDDKPLSYADIARRLGLTEDLVKEYIANLINKGIPVIKRFHNHQEYIILDPHFKQDQAKSNILQLHPSVIGQFSKYIM